ncbi:hypothetical protein HWV62_27311 [Athelia sp. TMB]|nr:hypothetical protein HWV62_27311 [Athelia sp. TMB]
MGHKANVAQDKALFPPAWRAIMFGLSEPAVADFAIQIGVAAALGFLVVMLPTHRQRSSQTGQTDASFLSKKSYRWLLYCVAFAGSLWLVVPYVIGPLGPRHRPGALHFEEDHGPLEFDEHRDSSLPHSRPRPPPPRLRPPPPSPPLGAANRPEGTETMSEWSIRADHVRKAYLHAWSGYLKLASPADELLPVSNGKTDNFNGWGVSIVDGLDTMWIMGLQDEFLDAMPIIADMKFFLNEFNYAPFFETVIRYLGGLLSAYALSGDPVLLSRADDLGGMLLPAFNTTSGFPAFAVNTVDGRIRQGWNGQNVLWAEALSCQMEYKYLAHLTGRTQYYDKVEHVMEIMYNASIPEGLFPTKWDLEKGIPSNAEFSVGAFADSAYEYLLKQWLMTGKSEPKSRDLYLKSATGIIDNLLFLSPKRKLLYVTDISFGNPSHTFEHLSCFLPGLLALGAHTLELPAKEKERHMWAAQGLAYTCYMTYADQATGLGPDEMHFDIWPGAGGIKAGLWKTHLKEWEEAGRPGGVPPGLGEVPAMPAGGRDYTARKTSYLLRPETLESFFILWKTTGDVHWRERGWDIFQAIENETKTTSGYASINSVDTSPSPMRDEMPSYFLAETLKYLYLLFSEEDIIPLDKWVFNTEGHPLPVYQWSEWEKKQYKII